MIISAMARDDEIELVRAAYDYNLALIGNGSLTEESFKKCREHAHDGFVDLMNALHPWAVRTKTDVRKAQNTQMIDLYKKYVGDPADPEFQKKIAKAVDKLNERVEVKVSQDVELAQRFADIRKAREEVARGERVVPLT